MAEWPLVGRSGELRRLHELIHQDDSLGIVLAGAAGVGKSRLVAECVRSAEGAGLATAQVVATRSAAKIPFGAILSLLPPFRPTDTAPVDDRGDLLRRAAAAVVEQAGGRRLLLVVDDAHLLDEASATLVHQMVVTKTAKVMATVRTGEPAPDPVVALWKDGLAERVELGGLPSEDLDELLTCALGGPVDRATAAQLAVRCQGNVLFLRELVLGARQEKTLTEEAGIWYLRAPLTPSDRLVELVEARLGDLDADERDLLELVSFGEPLGSAELSGLADLRLAEELEGKGLIISRFDRRRLELRLAHPLYGDVLRARLPALRVRSIARSLAEVVEAAGARRREDVLRVATWRLVGGGGSPDLLLAAATTARWHYDFPLAEDLARAALAAGAGFEASLLAAQSASLQGHRASAEAELAALAAQAVTDAQRCVVAHARLDACLFSNDFANARRLAEEAEATIADPAARDELTARRCWLTLFIEGPAASAEAAEALLGRAEGKALVWTCLAGSYALLRIGRLDTALDVASRGFETQMALVTPLDWYPSLFLILRCEALTQAGRLEEAEDLATTQYHQALTERSSEEQAQFAWQLSKILRARGGLQTAARYAREAVALFRQLGRPINERDGLISLALILSQTDASHDAGDVVRSLELLGVPSAHAQVDLLQARAWVNVANGDLPGACRFLQSAASLGEKTGDLVGAAAALHDVVRLGHAGEVAQRLSEIAALIDGPLAATRAAHARAVAGRDPAGLEEVASAFETQAALLLAAEAAADAAVAWRKDGEPRKATAAERRARALADRCEGAQTPALQGIEARSRLTPAEREAALLAASGRSNKQIAGQLSVSVRTVEYHLQHVYEKLGISSRDQLVEVVQQGSIPR